MQITVNGTRHDVTRGAVTYETIANLAVGNPEATLSVTYRLKTGPDAQRSGILAPGETVEGDDGMIFNAYHTGNA